MVQYVVKRLLLMVVTLFGITIITFVVTRLAPGDPAKTLATGPATGGRDAQQTEEIIEMNRRYYGFDKPLLINWRGADRRSEAADALKRYLTASESYSAQTMYDLVQVDAIALDAAVARASAGTVFDEATSVVERARLKTIVAALAERLGAQAPPPADAREWPEWRRGLWDPSVAEGLRDEGGRDAVLEEAARRYVQPSGADADAVERAERLLLAGAAYSVAALMVHTLEGEGERAERASRLAARLARKPWAVSPEMSPAEKAEAFERWRRWWRYDYVRFSTFSWPRRLVRHFTFTQYGIWLSKILTLDFDVSYMKKRPVLDLIKERLPISIQLSLISIFLAYVIAIPLGVYSSIRQYSRLDRLLTVVLFVLYSLPSFWVGNMFILYLTGKPFLAWFPSTGLHTPELTPWTWEWLKDWVWHLALPITCLTYGSFAFLSRQMRVSMLETVRQDFIRTARAKGLSERVVIFKHAMRNSLIPILTLSATLLPELLGGSVIIEQIFTIDGMGRLTWEAILQRDYPVINGVLFFSALLTLLGILLADLSYAWADPRIKLE